jgi:tripartite ATP-independent transporter DctM subunit
LKDILPYAVLIVLILGAIFSGVMTPTESAAMGAILSILLALVYRKMTFKALKESLWAAVSITSMVAFLMFTARVLGQIFQYTGIIDEFSYLFLNLPGGKFVTIAAIFIMYILLGDFFDSLSMMVLTLPFVSPVIAGLGYSPIWFGIVYVIVAEIGLLTPPMGLNLFVLHNALPQHSVMAILVSTLPFMIPLALMIALLTVFPELVLWLPNILY